MKSRTIKAVFLMIVVACLLTISIDGVASAQVFFGYSTRRVPVYAVDTPNKQVAISFDATWGEDKTQGILDNLKEYNAGATFFLVGFWVDKNPNLVKNIDECGIEIGCHSNTHPDMTKIGIEAMQSELTLCTERIKAITQKDVKLFRPPYGAYNNELIDTASSLGMQTIQWDVDSLDWKGISAEEITSRILGKVKSGSIILCHNDAKNILNALPMVLDRLTKQGYKITSVGDLIYQQNYTIDRNGIQHLNS